MSGPSLSELRARVGAIKQAPLLQKAALAELALNDFLHYLATLEQRVQQLEKGAGRGTE